MTSVTVAAVDLGAESGRVAACRFDGRAMQLEVIHRFTNQPVAVEGRLHWDIDDLWRNVSAGLEQLGSRSTVASTGVDAWGIDFGLYREGALLEAPLSYRDPQRRAAFVRAIEVWGPTRLYEATGTYPLEINTVFALLAEARTRPALLGSADLLLMLPDVFHRFMSGSAVTERTAASTTGVFDVTAGQWATSLMDRIGLPTRFLPEVVAPGTDIGALRAGSSVAGLARTRVIVPAAHDTASAVLAIPRLGPDTMFISSGTWSLVGVVLDKSIRNEAAFRAALTNEAGYGGTVRFLRNVLGLWILQECRRQWQSEGREVSYDELAVLAADEPPLQAFVDLNAVEFLAAGNMPGRIQRACATHSMTVPQTMGQVARVAIDSLALAYRLTLDDLEQVLGRRIVGIAVVGGGTENAVLQLATASATGRPVTCWAREATAIGNATAQLASLGEVHGLDEIWDLLEASTPKRTFAPETPERWHDAAARLRSMRQDAAERDDKAAAPDGA